jgi:outer membrane protein OmpA-like peptidoglycan-associated protein
MNSCVKAFAGIFLFSLFVSAVPHQEQDVEGSKDHPLLTRMHNYYISDYEEREYASHEFYDQDDNEYVIEGHKWVISYTLKEGFNPPGQLKVRRNFINAIKEIGGTVLHERGLYMKVAEGEREIWIEVWASDDGSDYELRIVERTVMAQEVVADPDAMAAGIAKAGHVAIYGIYFDFDRHDIKPESEPTLDAIAEMLKANPSLSVYVVGHTDMKGTLEYNLDLSSKRAKAVVDALVTRHGLPANRLEGRGVGPLCPVSTNKTEDGRKLNRRVELVEM